MVRIRPERFPQGANKKLEARSAGPFEIISKIGANIYILDIPSDWCVSSNFNVEDLAQFQDSATMPSNPFVHPSESESKLENSTIPNNPIPLEIPIRHEQI